MNIKNLFPGNFASNCYIVSDSGHALVIDPSAKAEVIMDELKLHHLVLDAIVLTHGHFDHMFSLDTLRELSSVPALIYTSEMDFPTDSEKNAYSNFYMDSQVWKPIEIGLDDDELLPIGDSYLKVLHTPGHTIGSICLWNEEENVIFTGDTIFKDGCGRTDLYSGNTTALLTSFKKLKKLPETLVMYPGHGEPGILGEALKPLSRII